MPSLTKKIPHNSDVARQLLREVRARVKASQRKMTTFEKRWNDAEEVSLAYLPEREVDARRRSARENGLPQYTTIQIPYTYAVMMSAHTYFSSVFMGRSPVFQYTGRHGESSQQIQAVEALMDYQLLVGQMLGPLYTWLYDSGKYGVGVLGSYWENRYEHVSRIQMVPELDPITGEAMTDLEGKPQMIKMRSMERIPGYRGNSIYNIQPWDFIFDVSFPIRDYQRGEYCGVKRTLSWNECKRREAAGYYEY